MNRFDYDTLMSTARNSLRKALYRATENKPLTVVADLMGIGRQTIYRLISKSANPRLTTLCRLAEQLDCSLSDLFANDD